MRKYNGKSNLAGELIQKYRILNNMSREDLAKKLQLIGLNLDRSHIFRMETGKVLIKDFELIAICKILKVNYPELESLLKD